MAGRQVDPLRIWCLSVMGSKTYDEERGTPLIGAAASSL